MSTQDIRKVTSTLQVLQNGASHQQNMQLQQQSGGDPGGVPAQALQNMEFGPLDTSSGMLPGMSSYVRHL